MKTIKTIVFTMIVATTSLNAQSGDSKLSTHPVNGVYRDYKEFIARHYTDSISSESKNSEKNNDFDAVVLKEGKHKRKYTEGQIYGYSLNGKDYRYFDSEKAGAPYGYFEIISSSGLIIYRQTENSNQQDVTYDYYYSRDLASPVKPLDKEYLKHELQNKEYVVSLFSLKDVCEFKNGEFTVSKIFNTYKTKPSDF
ncbi:MAG TPA: hypothetical protein VK835_06450 [Bacteroidia bacterium]|jgi:hypothetical protein|nr:hypothetical protein [Bacteroidia bacterium]